MARLFQIGIPFSFTTGKKGAFYGIGLCLGIGIFYSSAFELRQARRNQPAVALHRRLVSQPDFRSRWCLDAVASENVENTETLLFWRFSAQFIAISIDAGATWNRGVFEQQI